MRDGSPNSLGLSKVRRGLLRIFLSYAREDSRWKDQVLRHLAGLEIAGLIAVFADELLEWGDPAWEQTLYGKMHEADVAILLLTPDYLASQYCMRKEVPLLLSLRTDRRLHIRPILTIPCFYQAHEQLAKMQLLSRDGQALSELTTAERDALLREMCADIAQLANDNGTDPPPPAKTGAGRHTHSRFIVYPRKRRPPKPGGPRGEAPNIVGGSGTDAEAILAVLCRNFDAVKANFWLVSSHVECHWHTGSGVQERVLGGEGLGEHRMTYVGVSNGEKQLDLLCSAELMRRLSTHLLEYELPSVVVALGALPLNANVRRGPDTLSEIEVAMLAWAQRDAKAQIVVALDADVLGTLRTGPYDEFYAVGGDSRLAIPATSLLRDGLAVELSLPALLFGHPGVAGLVGGQRTQRTETVARETAPKIECLEHRARALWFRYEPSTTFDENSKRLRLLLAMAMAQPDVPSAGLPLLDEQRARLLACAVEREIVRRSDRVVYWLCALGVTRGSRVALAVPRPWDLLVRLLGFVKAGATSVPLDPLDPGACLELMLTDARWDIRVTDSDTRGRLLFRGRLVSTGGEFSDRHTASARPTSSQHLWHSFFRNSTTQCCVTGTTLRQPAASAVVPTQFYELVEPTEILLVTSPMFADSSHNMTVEPLTVLSSSSALHNAAIRVAIRAAIREVAHTTRLFDVRRRARPAYGRVELTTALFFDDVAVGLRGLAVTPWQPPLRVLPASEGEVAWLPIEAPALPPIGAQSWLKGWWTALFGQWLRAHDESVTRMPVASYRAPDAAKRLTRDHAEPSMDAVGHSRARAGSAWVSLPSETAGLALVGDMSRATQATWRTADSSGVDVTTIESLDAHYYELLRENGTDREQDRPFAVAEGMTLPVQLELPPGTDAVHALDELGALGDDAPPDTSVTCVARLGERPEFALWRAMNRRLCETQCTRGAHVHATAADMMMPFDALYETGRIYHEGYTHRVFDLALELPPGTDAVHALDELGALGDDAPPDTSVTCVARLGERPEFALWRAMNRRLCETQCTRGAHVHATAADMMMPFDALYETGRIYHEGYTHRVFDLALRDHVSPASLSMART